MAKTARGFADIVERNRREWKTWPRWMKLWRKNNPIRIDTISRPHPEAPRA